MTIGQRIEARRKELGLSQDELAARTGYKGRAAISKIESDVNQLRQSKIVDFANALDTTVDYIMGWSEEKAAPTISAKKQRLIDAVADMSDSDVDMLLGLISRIKKGD